MEFKERVVIKAGSSSLTKRRGQYSLKYEHYGLDTQAISSVASQAAFLRLNRNCEVAIVASGAVAAGRYLLGEYKSTIEDAQVLAAFGQSELISAFTRAFARRGILTAQFLLTGHDLERPLLSLMGALKRGVAVINANDPVNDVEMRQYAVAADNDQLAGLVAKRIFARKLILLTDTDGVLDTFHSNQTIRSITSVEEYRDAMRSIESGERSSIIGTGGMGSKLRVAWESAKLGKDVWIADAKKRNVILKIMDGEQVGTHVYVPGLKR
jgi:glutamate 5-kinase